MTPEQLRLFVGRTNTFSMQLDSGGYIPIRKNIENNDLQDHLDGKKTYGSYVIREDGMVTYGVIDIDGDKDYLPILKRLGKVIFSSFKEFSRVLEFSGRRGYHVWIFFKRPERPRFVRELIKTRLKSIGLRNIEVFPKQDKLTGKGLGNLIKLPCGLHRLGGKSEIVSEVWLK